MKVTRLALHTLHSAILAGDINACCSLLRQLNGSESTQSLSSSNSSFTSSSSLLTSSSALSLSSEEVLITQVLELGQTCLNVNANLVHESSVQMLCYSAQQRGRWKEALAFCRHLRKSPSPLFLASLLTPENTCQIIEECTQRGWSVDVLNAVRLLQEPRTTTFVRSTTVQPVTQTREHEWTRVEQHQWRKEDKHLQYEEINCESKLQKENKRECTNAQHKLSASMENDKSMVHKRMCNWRTALAIASCAERTFAHNEPFTLAVLIPFLSANNAASQAHALFDSALSHGLLTDGTLVEQIIRQTAEHGEWASCLYMLEKLNETHETSYLMRHATSQLFERLIECAPEWGIALRFMKLALSCEVKPTQRSVGLLLRMCEQSGDEHAAVEVYDMAVREGIVEQLQLHQTRHTFLKSFSALQQWEKALEALSWMSAANEASTFAGMTEFVELCEQSGQWEAAIQISTRLIEHEPRLHTIPSQTVLSILLIYAKANKWSDAVQLYTRLIEDARVYPHPLALCAVLQSCSSAKQWRVALKIFHSVRSQRPRFILQPLAYRLVLNVCMLCERWEEANEMLELMQTDEIALDSHCQRLGLRAAAKIGKWQRAFTFLRAIPAHQRTLEDRTVVLKAARQAGPLVSATVMRYLTER